MDAAVQVAVFVEIPDEQVANGTFEGSERRQIELPAEVFLQAHPALNAFDAGLGQVLPARAIGGTRERLQIDICGLAGFLPVGGHHFGFGGAVVRIDVLGKRRFRYLRGFRCRCAFRSGSRGLLRALDSRAVPVESGFRAHDAKAAEA